jgi:DNA transposition AAA+ family ATPase
MDSTAKIYTLKNDIRSYANEYITKHKMSITDFSSKINLSRSAVTSYLMGKYGANPANIEKAITNYFKEIGELDQSNDTAAETQKVQREDFLQTQDADNLIGVCQSCQEFMALGVIVGRSGYGKSYTLEHYAKRSQRVCYIECEDGTGCRDLVEMIEEKIGLPAGYGSIAKRSKRIKDFLNVNKGYLLIIDEADKLLNKNTQKKMEILRAIYDQSDVGLVISGEPSLEAMIKMYLPRFANRVDFYYLLKGISRKEVEKYCEGFKFTREALEEMVVRATNSKSGCFRLLDRTFRNIFRRVPEDAEITLDIVEKASRMMML